MKTEDVTYAPDEQYTPEGKVKEIGEERGKWNRKSRSKERETGNLKKMKCLCII